MAIDKFTKLIEYKPVTNLKAEHAVEFFTGIIHRFGVPNRIITDLGSQFMGGQFFDFSEEHCIQVYYVSVVHPCTNGQAERANGFILDGLRS